jgi:hypothetical protein
MVGAQVYQTLDPTTVAIDPTTVIIYYNGNKCSVKMMVEIIRASSRPAYKDASPRVT